MYIYSHPKLQWKQRLRRFETEWVKLKVYGRKLVRKIRSVIVWPGLDRWHKKVRRYWGGGSRLRWAILILISDLQRKWIPPGRPVSSLSSLPLPLTRHINTHQTNYIHRTIHHAPVIPFYIVLLPLLPTCLTKQPQHRNHTISFVGWVELIFAGLFLCQD